MKQFHSLALLTAVALTSATGFTACSSDESLENNPNVVIDDNGNAGVKSEFVISVPRTVVGQTRMGDDVTQSTGSVAQFRGIDNIRLIPFAAAPTAGASSLAGIMRLSAVSALNSPGTVNYKVYADQFVPVGTKNFLFYGKAIDVTPETAITTMDEKFRYGVLNAQGLTDESFSNPGSILFSLEQINTSTAPQAGNATGQNIVQLLTSLANTTISGVTSPNDAWSTTNNVTMASLYRNFIGITTGSSATLSVILSKLYFSMDHIPATDPARQLATTIKSKVEAACAATPVAGEPVVLTSSYTGYPGNIGLPDGAVRIRWNATTHAFVDVTANYGKSFRQRITDYVYPAALWYYTNTPLKAATSKKSDQYDTQTSWANVISGVYTGAVDEVQPATQSIALTNPAEYGVGRVETKVSMGPGTFYDGAGHEVVFGSGYTLKGLLIGGQNSVGYDFKPKGSENMTIYDRDMSGSSLIAVPGYTTAANQTLALETESDQVVYGALELINGGEDFMGLDGIIPAGGTFYLTVKLDPTTASNYAIGTLDKIIQQDHVTKLTVTIKNGSTTVDRNGDGIPDKYIKDGDGKPIGVDIDGDGVVDPYDVDGDGRPDDFITDPTHGGPGWDTDGDGEVDLPVTPSNEDGGYPDTPNIPDGLGGATNGIPDLSSPGIELGTSVDLTWEEGLILNPNI